MFSHASPLALHAWSPQVQAVCEKELKQLVAAGSSNDSKYWVLATLGEVCVILGNLEDAVSYYHRALKRYSKQINCSCVTRVGQPHLLTTPFTLHQQCPA